jgi:uncharacterized protein DUF2784
MRLLADAILVVHFLIAAFVTAGFVLVPLGAWRHWRFVRRRGLRLLHLGAVSFVALEALVGIACPLTVWENALRGVSDERGFIAHWVGRWLYYDAPLWIFTTLYVAAAAIALIGWRLVPPERRTPRQP